MAQNMDETIRVRIPEDLKAKLEAMAAPRLLTVSDIAREALLRYVGDAAEPAPEPTPVDG